MSDQPKHSPLPWHWWDKKDGRPLKYDLAKLLDANRDWILTLYGGSGRKALGSSPQDRANAKLIVASVNHAGQLAKALRDEINCKAGSCKRAQAALAAWEKEQNETTP